MNQYKWAPGSRMSNKTAPPQVIGERLNGLQEQHGGRINARIVVDDARPEESPTHSCFEWDNVVAGELYREDQARHIINSIRIVQSDPTVTPSQTLIHAFVSLVETVGDDKERGYVPLARVLSEPDLLQQAVMRAESELRAMESRYKEFDMIVRTIKAAREQLKLSEVA